MKFILLALLLMLANSAFGQAPAVPAGMVTYFSQAGQTTCPSGWTEAQYAHGRLILAVTDPTQAQITAGTALGDAQLPLHAHPFTATAAVRDKLTATAGGSDKGVGAAGSYGTNGTTGNADPGFPFVQFLVCEAMNSSGDALPYGSVSHFNTSSCPTNWDVQADFQGRFLLPLMSSGVTVGWTTQEQWQVVTSPSPAVQIPTHQHAITSTISLGSKGFVWGGGATHGLASPGSQSVTGTAAANTQPIVPVVTLLTCQKTASSSDGQLPVGLTIFFSAQECLLDWCQTDGAPGRFVVGMAGGGTQGATFGGEPMKVNETQRSHVHTADGSFTIPNHDTDLSTTGIHNLHLGEKGTYSFSADTGDALTSLPYVVLQSCTNLTQ